MPGTLQVDSVGPVDVAVIGFEGDQFNGDIAPALLELADSGVVRIIDVSFVGKGVDGTVTTIEAEDSEVAEAYERVTATQFDLLSDEDIDAVAEDLEPGTAAMVIVWENTWAARLAQSIRASNGRLISLDRVPHETIVSAITALEEE